MAGKKGKLSRRKRKLNRNPHFSSFVKNKWNGKEPIEEFYRREFKLWNNLPSSFKRQDLTRKTTLA
jgi:hypothetical protein